MKRLPRPSTAPATKRPMEERPLGTKVPSASSPPPPIAPASHALREQVAAHGCNSAAVVASLKGDVMLLQRRIDALRPSTSEMENLERYLMSITSAAGDERASLENQAKLLELLVQRFNVLCLEAARAFGDGQQGALSSTATTANNNRTGGVLSLIEQVQGISARKKLWEHELAVSGGGASHHSAFSHPGSVLHAQTEEAAMQTSDRLLLPDPEKIKRNALDDALNEPTVSQLRVLINEQKTLQQAMRDALLKQHQLNAKTEKQQQQQQHGPGATAAAAATAAASHHHAHTGGGAAESLKTEVQELKRKLTAADTELASRAAEIKSLKDELLESGQHEVDLQIKRASHIAFAQLPVEVAVAAGVDTSRLTFPEKAELDTLTNKIHHLLVDAHHHHHNQHGAGANDGGAAATRGGRKNAASRQQQQQQHHQGQSEISAKDANLEAALWFVFQQQAEVVGSLCEHIQELGRRSTASEEEHTAEVEKLQRVIAGLDERVRAVKASAAREAQRVMSSSSNVTVPQLTSTQTKASASAVKPGASTRIVDAKNQSLTGAAKEKAQVMDLHHKQQCIHDLQIALEKARDELAAVERGDGLAAKERARLLQQVTSLKEENAKLSKLTADHAQELQQVKTQLVTARKELREKAATEAEVQQNVWKLDVELHIAQNVINELRSREDTLSKEIQEAKECQKLVTDALEKERQNTTKELAKSQQSLRAAKSEEAVAKQVLQNERLKMIENEKEVDRLRALDLKMDVLEQNFTNYAACKLAQREAVEEEERALQACVDAIGKDVFVLPANVETEEQVQLFLKKLQAQKEAFDAEERMRKRHKATMVNFKDERSGRKQLTSIMQMRYNAIQIFAAEQRLRQLSNERAQRKAQTEATEHKSKLDTVLIELSHAKMQCDSLVQRNSELEYQRKELLKSRSTGEQECKNLKNTVHKMRVANEEQEKMIVEMGTKLQEIRMRDGEQLGKIVTDP